MGVNLCCKNDNRTELGNEYHTKRNRSSNDFSNELITDGQVKISSSAKCANKMNRSCENHNFVNNNHPNNISDDEKNSLLNIYSNLYKSDTLIKAENKFQNFNKLSYNTYNISSDIINKLYDEEIYHEIFTFEEENVSYYSGEKNKNHQKHGYGILLFITGENYEGYWDSDIFNIFGRYINCNGEVYEGCFRNYIPNGNGKLMNVEPLYEGEFFNGKKQGIGKEKSEIEEYEGEFKNDKRDGKGILKFTKTNNIYIGDFTEGFMTGNCIFEWSNGDRYEGFVSDGIFRGSGKYFWKNGNIYEGNYENGSRSGKGVFKWNNGKTYIGDFKNNFPHGNGVIIENGIEKSIKFNKGKLVIKKNSRKKSDEKSTSTIRKITNNEKSN